MKTRSFIIVLCVILSGIILSCQSWTNIYGSSMPPDKDDYLAASTKAVSSTTKAITPEMEYIIGQEITVKILESYKIWNEKPNLTEYLNRICMSLVIKSSRPDLFNGYIVSILDSNEVISFAIPGGHIYLTRGLINTAKSEKDLALIIAREIAHLQFQHAVILTEESIDAIIALLTVGYSREQQKEADDYAIKLLNNAGYNIKQDIRQERFTAVMKQ